MIYACEQKRPEVLKQREEWTQFIKSVDPEKLVFLDENGVNTDFTRNYRRSIGKSRVVDHIQRNTPKNTTVVSSIRHIKNILCPTLKSRDIVVMDNLSVHKNKDVEKIINLVGAKVKYLPPYSPDLNPIEMMWKII